MAASRLGASSSSSAALAAAPVVVAALLLLRISSSSSSFRRAATISSFSTTSRYPTCGETDVARLMFFRLCPSSSFFSSQPCRDQPLGIPLQAVRNKHARHAARPPLSSDISRSSALVSSSPWVAVLLVSPLALVAVEEVEQRPSDLPELYLDLFGGQAVQGLPLQAVEGHLPQLLVGRELRSLDVTLQLVLVHIPSPPPKASRREPLR